MRLLKRLLLMGGIVAAITMGVLTWLYIGLPGSIPVTTWIAQQIATVLEGYITPRISFASLEYQRPFTVVIRDFALTSEGRTLMSIDQAVLGLAEIPREGRPIKIQEINLENPRITFEAAPDGQLIGWSQFLRPEVVRNPRAVPQGRRLSDVLVLRHVQISGGEVRYQGADDPEPMVLPGIELVLQTPPEEMDPGWYGLVGTLKREPIFNANVNGRINLDAGLLELQDLRLAATLGPDKYATLPPRLQNLLRRYHTRGELSATFTGRVPIGDPARTTASLAVGLKDAHLNVDEVTLALADLQISGTLPDGKISLEARNGALTHSGYTLIGLDRLQAELPGIPDGDGPVEIARADVSRARVDLITAPEGGFVGWNQLGQLLNDDDTGTPGDAPGRQAHASEPPATAPARVDTPLNSYVRIRQARIHDSRFAYGLPGGGTPLTLDHIDIELQPGPQDKAEGWQPVTASARTDGLFAATLAGRFDTAALVLDLDRFKLTGSITGEQQYAMLPPQAQDVLRSHQAQGDLTATFSGRFPIVNPAQTRGTLTADVRNPRLTAGAASVALESFHVSGALPDGKINLEASKASLTQGAHRLLAVDGLLAELPGIPSGNGSIEIANLEVERVQAELIAAPEGGFAGWNQLLPKAADTSVPTNKIRIRQAEILNSRFVCGLPDGGAPLTLDHINISLQPRSPGEAGGRQRIIASADSKDLFVTSLGGWFDADSLALDVDQFKLMAGITGKLQYTLLPEPVETIFREHGVVGDLSVEFQGRVPLASIEQTTGRTSAQLSNGEMHFAAIDLPVEQARFDFDVPTDNIRASLAGMALVSGGFRIVDIGRMRMELVGPPRAGGPLDIRSAVFEDPFLRFVQAEDDGFLGWRDLVDPESEWPRLSDFVRFEKVQIVRGKVLLDDSDPYDAGPMVLSGINATFRTPPIPGSPGWYRLAASAIREPLFNVQFDGRINPDEMLLDADSFSLKAQLGEQQYSTFPPHFQTLLRRYEVQGNLAVSANGRVPMLEPARSKLTARADLRDARIAFTDVAWPIQHVALDARMDDEKVAARYNANLLGGHAGGEVRLGMDDPNPIQGTWSIDDFRMEHTLRVVQQGTPKYAGVVDSQGSFRANLDDFPTSLAGSGTLQVINGRLFRLPIIRELITLISKVTLGLVPRRPDTADAEFTLRPDHVAVDRLKIDTRAIILRVSGDIHYDETVDLDVRTEVARKAGQNIGEGIGEIGALGGLSPFRKASRGFGRVLGKGLGAIADTLSIAEHIIGYRVSGTLSNPHVSVQTPPAKRRAVRDGEMER